MNLSIHPIPDVADEVHLSAEMIEVADVLRAVQKDPEWFFSLGRDLLHTLPGSGAGKDNRTESGQ
jgi:hypothetical protein